MCTPATNWPELIIAGVTAIGTLAGGGAAIIAAITWSQRREWESRYEKAIPAIEAVLTLKSTIAETFKSAAQVSSLYLAMTKKTNAEHFREKAAEIDRACDVALSKLRAIQAVCKNFPVSVVSGVEAIRDHSKDALIKIAFDLDRPSKGGGEGPRHSREEWKPRMIAASELLQREIDKQVKAIRKII